MNPHGDNDCCRGYYYDASASAAVVAATTLAAAAEVENGCRQGGTGVAFGCIPQESILGRIQKRDCHG